MSKLSKQVLSFVFISILTINVFSIPVFATDKIETQHEEETTIEELGGGPSPSGAWEYSKTIKKTFTQNQLKKLNTKLQAAVKKGEKTQTAYDAALYLVGIFGLKSI